MPKVKITHPKLRDKRGRPVTADVNPRQAKVLADSGWVPVDTPEPSPEPTPEPQKRPAKKAAPKTDTTSKE